MPPRPRSSVMEISPYVPGRAGNGKSGRVIKMSSNETPLGTNPAVVEAIRAVAEGVSRYPEPSSAALREALGAAHGIDPARIVCGNGSDELLTLLAIAYAESGDEVLYAQHGFLVYSIAARTAGAVPVRAPETDLTVNVDAMIEHATERTRVCFVANPNNPTGTVLRSEDLRRLRRGLPESCLLVIDSAYAEYVAMADYEDGRAMVDDGENVVMTRTFSKIYGLAGLRLGWAYCPPAVTDALNRIRGPFNVDVCAQAAGLASLENPSFVGQARAHNARWRPWLEQALSNLGLEIRPGVANFVLATFPEEGPHTAAAAYEHLMGKGILPRRVAEYDLPCSLRFTVGLEKENQQAAAEVARFLGQPVPA